MPFDTAEKREPPRNNAPAEEWRVPDRATPWWVRALGGDYYEGRTFRARWGEFVNQLGFGLQLSLFEKGWSLHLHLGWPGVYLNLPFLPRREPDEMMESWGFGFTRDGLHLRWGAKSKVLFWFWEWRGVLHEVLCQDGRWREYKWEKLGGKGLINIVREQRVRWSYPYKYLTNGGELQEVTATVCPERCTRYPRRWLRWPCRIEHSINVEFSDQVGNRRGSWKGGVTACGWPLRPGETARYGLRRMERTRRFCR